MSAIVSPAPAPAPTPAAGQALANAFAGLPSHQRFTPEQREVVYRLAYTQLAAGEAAAARRYFEWLVVYGGSEVRHWRGLAAACLADGDAASALLHWTIVGAFEPGAADALFHAARCQALLGEVHEALATLALVEHLGDPHWRAQAAQLAALLRGR